MPTPCSFCGAVVSSGCSSGVVLLLSGISVVLGVRELSCGQGHECKQEPCCNTDCSATEDRLPQYEIKLSEKRMASEGMPVTFYFLITTSQM